MAVWLFLAGVLLLTASMGAYRRNRGMALGYLGSFSVIGIWFMKEIGVVSWDTFPLGLFLWSTAPAIVVGGIYLAWKDSQEQDR